MPAWSPEIANEFIRLGFTENARAFTQMQLQKLVYFAHGWNLAITGETLTFDDPKAFDFGPVYPELWDALRRYGRGVVTKPIKRSEYSAGLLSDADPNSVAYPELSPIERQIVRKIYDDYGRFPAFQLSAITHEPNSPWTRVYGANGSGKYRDIPPDLIKDYFVELANRPKSPEAAEA